MPEAAGTNRPGDLLTRLSAKFPVGEVKQRKAGGGSKMLDYISIDMTINRLNEVLGLGWSFTVQTSSVTLTALTTDKGKPLFLATVQGELSFRDGLGDEHRHAGVGADLADDPDKALKTALAEALKKAGHQLGIALYLWAQEERDELNAIRTLDLNELKNLVASRAVREGVNITGLTPELAGQAVAAHFNVPITDLATATVLAEILER